MENAAHYLDVLMERDHLESILTFLPRAKRTTLHGSHAVFTLWIKHFLRAKMEPISQEKVVYFHIINCQNRLTDSNLKQIKETPNKTNNVIT